MASSLRYHRNQLQFNVGLPHSNENIAQKFLRPAPVMFDKLGATPNTTFCHEPSPQPLQFSVVSEERLSQAILLARRDLKKQRQQVLYEDMNAKSKKVCVKKKQSKASQPETTSRPVTKDTKIDVKPLSARSRLNRENQPPRSNLGLPRRSMSPPTRDVDQKQNPGNDDQLLHEIERLHQQLISCLKQIQTIADTAKQGKVQWIGQAPVGVGELSVAVEQSRRTQRAEEMGIRLTRVLYGLQHQTRAIQNDLQRTTLEHLRPIQKSRYLQRLASVHRGAVRAMHMLVTQLGDIDLTDVTELPHTYTELRLLIEQLAICCTQVEMTAEVCIPQSVTNLIGQMQLMNDNVNQQLKESKHKSEHNQSKECIIRDVDHNAHTTPDRRSMLQQGLAALYNESNHSSTANGDLNAAKRKFSNAQVSIDPTESPPLQLPSSMLHKQKAVPRKGILLPAKLQNKHVRYERLPNNNAACRSNYTAPTLTSQLKAVEVTSMQTHPKPLTPRKSEKICSPRSTLSTDKPPKSPSRHKIQDIHAELIRDLLKEREIKPALYHQSAIDPEYIASRTEKAVRDALKPILKRNDSQMVANQQLLNAQDISQSEFEYAQVTSQSEFENSSYMDDSELTLKSRSLNDTADLQNIMKRLEDMEKEHTSIQNRWHTIIYEDINKYNQYTKYYDVQSSEAPDHPAPIQITLTEDADNMEPALWVHDPQNSHEINKLHQFDLQEADSGITFTKPSKSKYQSEELGLFQQGSKDSSVMPERPLKYVKPSSVRLCLMPNHVRGIRQEAKRLKKSAFKLESWKISTFEPWQLIEEFSDDIMNQCFDDVFQEFNDIQDDIIKNIYETELREADN